MPDFQLQTVIDSLRERLQAELDAQLGAITAGHTQAVDDARRAAEAEAEQRWTARLDTVRTEWSSRLESEVTSARADAEQRLVAESMRVRVEAEQSAAETAAQAREELERALRAERDNFDAEREKLEHALAAEREKLEAEREKAEAEREKTEADHQRLADERTRMQARLDEERERAERALAEAQMELEAERQRAQAALEARANEGASDVNVGRLREAIAAIGAAPSLSDVLALTAAAAAAEAPRAALFVVNGPQIEEWNVPSVPALSPGAIRVGGHDAGALADALRDGAPIASGAAPTCAALPFGRASLAAPLMLGGQAVAVLYADEGQDGEGGRGWIDAVEILARHASACLAHLTAVRTAQAIRLLGAQASGQAPAARGAADDQGARRYARLLVSEIKMYNDAAVRTGREKRDLLRRLKPEIDRARRLYDERIPPSVAGRDACFEQELVQTLADGDASLLG